MVVVFCLFCRYVVIDVGDVVACWCVLYAVGVLLLFLVRVCCCCVAVDMAVCLCVVPSCMSAMFLLVLCCWCCFVFLFCCSWCISLASFPFFSGVGLLVLLLL